MQKYSKLIVMVLVTVATALSGVWTDGITAADWVNVAIAAVGAAGVFAAPNVPGAKYTKSVLAVLAAVLTFLVSAIAGGISPQEWIQIFILAAGAVGVYAVPNVDEAGQNISDTGSLGTA
jgi:hypothetical protein